MMEAVNPPASCCAIPKGFNRCTWAEREEKEPYCILAKKIRWVRPAEKHWVSWCCLCRKWGENKSHWDSKDHLGHVVRMREIYMDFSQWSKPGDLSEWQIAFLGGTVWPPTNWPPQPQHWQQPSIAAANEQQHDGHMEPLLDRTGHMQMHI
jgi:hypothetical protein